MEVFKVKTRKQPKVVKKKLGKEQAYGQFWEDKNLIEIDERLKGKKELIIYIHEYFHKLFPKMEEDELRTKSEHLADFLWKNHYRKVDLSGK